MFRILIPILLLINIAGADLSGKIAISDTATVSGINAIVANLLDTNAAWTLKKSKALTANLTIPKTQEFSIADGVKLNLAGYTLRIKNGDKFGDSSIVGSGTVIFDTCAVEEFHSKWIGSPFVVCSLKTCGRDTTKVTVFQATNAGIGSLSTTIHLSDSTYARTERLTGKSYAAGGYNGDLTGTAQYADSCKGGSVRSATSKVSDSSGVSRNVNGGYVNAATGLFKTALDTKVLSIDGDPVYILPIVGDSFVNINSGYNWILGDEVGWLAGDAETGMAIYDNRVISRNANGILSGFKLADIDSIKSRIIITNVMASIADLEIGTPNGDLIIDVGGVTNLYSRNNINIESIEADVNIQSDVGDINISAGDSIHMYGVIHAINGIRGDLNGNATTATTATNVSGSGEVTAHYGTFTNTLETNALDVNADLRVNNRIYHPLDVLNSISTYNMDGVVNLTENPYSYWEIILGDYNTWQFNNCPLGTVVYVRNTAGITQYIELTTGQTSTDVSILPGELWQMVCVAATANVWQWKVNKFDY